MQITKADDMHLHLREGEMLKKLLPYTSKNFKRAVVMPNLIKSITTAKQLIEYKNYIKSIAPNFTPLMTFKITPNIKKEEIEKMKTAGAIAGKLYPQGVTTNSQDGVSNIEDLYPIFNEMSKQNIVLSIHGENPDSDVFCAEKNFLPEIVKISKNFPNLKIVLEHLSTKEAVDLVISLNNNIAATITVHHLYLSINEILGSNINIHNFCKPIAKKAEDREALQKAVLSGNKKFFFGSDSAPHLKEKKEAGGLAGVYTSPYAIPLLAEFFDKYNEISKIENFLSVYGANFYNLDKNTETLSIIEKEQKIPNLIEGVVPFYAGRKLKWQVC